MECAGACPCLERDAAVLRSLAYSRDGRGAFSPRERNEVLQRSRGRWPEQPSVLLRLAAVAYDLEKVLDERFAAAPQQLVAWASRDPWSVEPDESETLRLAALVCLEQLDYVSFVPSYGTPMVLRDALTGREDLATVAAMARWDSLARLEVSTPDRLFASWTSEVTSLARDGHERLDSSEYDNMLDIRGYLQRFVAALSWAGQAQWREQIETVDETFRSCTDHQDIPLALSLHGEPGGWWRYRLPSGAPASPGWAICPLRPDRYVAGYHGRGLRTISHIWDLAKRPYGIRAMTDQELRRWAALCAFQAQALPRRRARQGGWWPDQHERAQAEQRRRETEAAPSD